MNNNFALLLVTSKSNNNKIYQKSSKTLEMHEAKILVLLRKHAKHVRDFIDSNNRPDSINSNTLQNANTVNKYLGRTENCWTKNESKNANGLGQHL